MNARLVFNLLGKVMLVEGAVMLLPLAVALIYGEGDVMCFVYSLLLVSAAGGALSLVRTRNDNLRPREGFATVALCWLALSAFGALPFVFGGYIPSFVDAFFETVSGFTTTGSTILTDVEVLPRGILFWRSLTHWVGGMGVLVLSLALVPRMGARSLNLLRAESPGPSPGKLVPRIGNTARILYRIYMGISVLQVIALLLCGMDLFDALIHMFGSAGTGGFSNYNMSIGHYANPAIENVTAVFLLLFSLNFSLYYFLLHRNFSAIWKSEEFWTFLAVVAASVGLIALNIRPQYENYADAFRYSFFSVSSIISTTGYATADFNLWPQFSRTLLVLLMLIGACAGSTGGGLKVIRINLLFKCLWREMRRTGHPRSVLSVKSEGRAVDSHVLHQIMMFFFVYMLIICLSTLIISLDGFSLETNLTASISAIGNIGPGLDMVGPVGNFSAFSPLSKLVLSACMLLGRLEIYPILMLFSINNWKRN